MLIGRVIVKIHYNASIAESEAYLTLVLIYIAINCADTSEKTNASGLLTRRRLAYESLLWRRHPKNITKFRNQLYISCLRHNQAAQAREMSCPVIIPSHAEILFKEGWTGKKIKEYMAKNSFSPFRSIIGTNREMDIDNLMILVAGGPGAWMGLLRSVGGFENALVTRKIELPNNWDKLAAKYKDMVPNHVSY